MLDTNVLQRMIYLMIHTLISVGMPRNIANIGAMSHVQKTSTQFDSHHSMCSASFWN